MTFLAIAEAVLKDSSPLNAQQIWDKALISGLAAQVKTTGKTPWATLGAQLYVDLKNNAATKFCKVGKGKFALAEMQQTVDTSIVAAVLPESINIEAAGNQKKVEKLLQSVKQEEYYLEKHLHPFLAHFAFYKLKAYAKTLNHSKSAKSSYGEWVHPDMVSCAFPFLQDGWHSEVSSLSRSIGNASIRLCSFELKRKLDMTNLREVFFQAVSNSSWANESYLVAAKISDSQDFLSELKRLSSSFNIGVIRLNTEHPDKAEIILPARFKENLDWDTMNKLAMNKDFKDFLSRVQKDLKSNEVYKEQYDKVFSQSELLKSIETIQFG
ncbi:HTH domain-containing protein [Hymenobacter sp. PAMC 26628]|uniref:HTH domain-containing protein n=1 Tax=Hymenobacter sp. PAMC 26628 TaxID=1484118 RepID=UPI000902035D|nr:HTH domain-containing protein [Hymenobacter sp. PAMC 26628]